MSEAETTRVPADEYYDAKYHANEGVELDYDIDDELVQAHIEEACHKTERDYDEVEVAVVEPEDNGDRLIHPEMPSVWGNRRALMVKVQFWKEVEIGKAGEKTVHPLEFVDGHESERVAAGGNDRPLEQGDYHLVPNRDGASPLVADAAEKVGYEFVDG